MQLEKVDLGDNRLRYLPDDLSRLMSVTDLDVSNNAINYLPMSIGQDLFNLKFLDLSFNDVGELPASCERLSRLMVLRMRANQVWHHGCPTVIQNLLQAFFEMACLCATF
jgi:Leucine-rich repeat (LRR) protein